MITPEALVIITDIVITKDHTKDRGTYKKDDIVRDMGVAFICIKYTLGDFAVFDDTIVDGSIAPDYSLQFSSEDGIDHF